MTTGLVQWGGQIFLTGLSAVFGAAALLILQTIWKRGRYLRAFQTELEQNLTRIERRARQLKNIENDDWRKQFSPLHLEVHQRIRIDDPTLFLQLNRKIWDLEEIYQGIRYLDRLSEPGVQEGPETSKEEVIDDLDHLADRLKEAVDTVESTRKDNWIYQQISSDESLYHRTISLGDDSIEEE